MFCLYFSVIEINDNDKPLDGTNSKSISVISDDCELSDDLINQWKDKYGINQEVQVIVKPFDESLITQIKNDLYMTEDDQDKQYESLKVCFMNLIGKLIKDSDLIDQINCHENVEQLLNDLLNYLGERPINDKSMNRLNRFRQNIHNFLSVSIKEDVLIGAFKTAESIDEAVINLLNMDCQLQ